MQGFETEVASHEDTPKDQDSEDQRLCEKKIQSLHRPEEQMMGEETLCGLVEKVILAAVGSNVRFHIQNRVRR